MILMNGKDLSAKIKDELLCKIESNSKYPCLSVITIGDDPSSMIYVNNKKKACEQVGIGFIHIKYESDVKKEKVIKKIKELNKNKDINGILLQLPLPDGFDERELLNEISPLKDVDGLNDISLGKLIYSEPNFVPCTAKGIIYILEEYNINLESKHVVVIGRSNLVGKPVMYECLKRNATCTICHTKTKDLKKYTKEADILIVATGSKYLVDKTMIKKDVVIVDVGISKIDGKIYGDVNPNVEELCSYLTPVPGGIGPMTVAMLLVNTYNAFIKQNGNEYEL